MKIKVKAHPNSSQEKIVEAEECLEIWLKEKAVDGKANEKILKMLKKYFGKNVELKTGFNSRKKVFEVKDEI